MTSPHELPERVAEFDRLLEELRRHNGVDLTGYKRIGLMRRVTKRMRAMDMQGFAEYAQYLRDHPDETTQLLNSILINVTAFFRDELPWEYLRDEIVPGILAHKGPNDVIRLWCAGCATGEEAYSLAIVFAEALGHDAFRERVKIYATDLDDAALTTARQANYGAVTGVPVDVVEKYFERAGDGYQFRKDLRRVVIFGRNDLLRDAPISRIDLLACRNTLMYFDAAAQSKILARFHFALNDEGFLFLGRAETMLTHNSMFAPVDLRRRVFVKVPRTGGLARLASLPRAEPLAPPMGAGALLAAALDVAPTAQIVVDRVGRLVSVNERARALFQLGAADLGRPLQDLEVSYRPFELRSVIDQAYGDRRPVARSDVPWRSATNDLRWFDIVVTPLGGDDASFVGANISCVEVTRYKQQQQQIQESQIELEAAYQELQSTNEELETTNEELHSTVEELETTNEELQSTNEELETMNEELQSTNEELQTTNDELRMRSDELDRLNSFLESILTSLRAGVAVLDDELRVVVWNGQAEELWGVRAGEVERTPFLRLDIGLPVAELRDAMRACLAGESPGVEVTLPATNRRGRAILCRTSVLPLVARAYERPLGVIVLMVEPSEEEAPTSAR